MIRLHFFCLVWMVPLSALLTSCGLKHFDAPPVTEENRWIKSGYSTNQIWQELVICGYDPKAWNMDQQVKVDECMLSRDFIFIDSPYGKQGSACKFQSNKNLPSCKSLEKYN